MKIRCPVWWVSCPCFFLSHQPGHCYWMTPYSGCRGGLRVGVTAVAVEGRHQGRWQLKAFFFFWFSSFPCFLFAFPLNCSTIVIGWCHGQALPWVTGLFIDAIEKKGGTSQPSVQSIEGIIRAANLGSRYLKKIRGFMNKPKFLISLRLSKTRSTDYVFSLRQRSSPTVFKNKDPQSEPRNDLQ